MISVSFRFVWVLAALVAALALSGCASTAVPPVQDDGTAERLMGAMEECLARQAAVDAKLEAQSEQLVALQGRLGSVAAAPEKPKPARQPERCPASTRDSGKLVVGRMEKIWFPNLDLLLAARVDTGAETSSIDARNVERFERNGKRWVRFEIAKPDSDEGIMVEREVSRVVSIVQSSQPEGERRPVIAMEIAVGSVKQTAEFTLSDRSHLHHQVMIGRNILQDVMIVDVSKKNVAPPATGGKSAKTGGAGS